MILRSSLIQISLWFYDPVSVLRDPGKHLWPSQIRAASSSFLFSGKMGFFFFLVITVLRLNQSFCPEMYYRSFSKHKLKPLPNPVSHFIKGDWENYNEIMQQCQEAGWRKSTKTEWGSTQRKKGWNTKLYMSCKCLGSV